MKGKKMQFIFGVGLALGLLVHTAGVFAADVKYKDDYEGYTLGAMIDGSKHAYKLLRNVLSVGNAENQYLDLILKNSLTAEEQELGYVAKPGRIIYDLPSAPSGKVLISLDFMTPRSSGNNVELFHVQYRDGNGDVAVVFLKDDKLYSADAANTVIREGIEANRWYNAQVLVDIDAKTYQVRCGNDFCEPLEFINSAQWLKEEVYDKLGLKWTEACADVVRVFSVTNNSPDVHIYIDNGEIAYCNRPELDTAAYEAYGLLVCAQEGYETGMYPGSVFTMLRDAYADAYQKGQTAGLEASEISAAAKSVKSVIATFQNSRIDTSVNDGVAAYLMTELTPTAVVGIADGYACDLNAVTTVYGKGNHAVDADVVWEMVNGPEGAAVADGKLTAVPGTEGEIVLKASAGDIYDKYMIQLIAERRITITEYVACDGKIVIKGLLNKASSAPVMLSIAGTNINVTKQPLVFDDNAAFVWEMPVADTIVPEDLVITIEGEEVSTLAMKQKYYGMQWREDVVEHINKSADAAAAAELLHEYSFGLAIADKGLYEKYQDSYSKRVYNGKSYADFAALQQVIAETNCVVAFQDATRQTIGEVVQQYMDLLTSDGFSKSKFEGLSGKQKETFYLQAAGLSIQTDNTDLSDICKLLNTIISNITEQKRPTGGGSSGGGRGSGSGSIGGGGGYAVTPVTDQPAQPSVPEIDIDKVEPFDDMEQAAWAKGALLYLKAKGILSGYHNQVRPNDAVTRGEFAKMLVVAFDLQGGQDGAFSDAQGSWWKPYAESAAANGIVNGLPDGTFGGDDVMNREMLAVMADRVITAKEIALYDQNEGNACFDDIDMISDYAAEAVDRLYRKGVVSGVGKNLFAPSFSVTRAEAAQMIYNVLIKQSYTSAGAQ